VVVGDTVVVGGVAANILCRAFSKDCPRQSIYSQVVLDRAQLKTQVSNSSSKVKSGIGTAKSFLSNDLQFW
jgi:hypothetical protein